MALEVIDLKNESCPDLLDEYLGLVNNINTDLRMTCLDTHLLYLRIRIYFGCHKCAIYRLISSVGIE